MTKKIYRDVESLTKELLKTLSDRRDIKIASYLLKHDCGDYDFIKIKSNLIDKEDKVVLIRANLHGDEIAGFYTMLYHLNEIFDYAHTKKIKLIVYPLANPSGFEQNIRYNGDGDKGDFVNNHFLHYELQDGTFLKDIGESTEFKNWYWASNPKLNIRLPAETLLMHKLLKEDPLSQVVGNLDLHQDYFTENTGPAAYYYAYEPAETYSAITNSIREIIPILGNTNIGAGFETSILSGEDGYIFRHDGSLPDLLYFLGCKHGITPETTGETPLDIACKVNLIWIKGIIDLVS